MVRNSSVKQNSNIRLDNNGFKSRLSSGVTYKGAKASKESTVEADVVDPVLIIVVYGKTAENDRDATPSVVMVQGATSIVVEVATRRHVCAGPYVLLSPAFGCE